MSAQTASASGASVPGPATDPPPSRDLWEDRGIRAALLVVAALALVILLGTVYGAFQGGISTAFSAFDLGGVVVLAVLGGVVLLVILLAGRRAADLRLRHTLLFTGAAATVVALLLWLALLPMVMVLAFSESLVFCVLPTAFAFWLLRRIQPTRRLPWSMLLLAAAWGMLIAPSLALTSEQLYSSLTASLIPGLGAGVAGAFSPGLFEEGAKGLGVVVLYLVFRDRIDGVIGGLCLGAAVGLGFNFLETGEYMFIGGIQGLSVGGFVLQLALRQGIGLLLGHAAYTALIGAGLGVARSVRGWAPKTIAIAAGFAAAIAGHYLWDMVAMTNLAPSSGNDIIDLFVLTPLQYIVLDGPFAMMSVALLVLGWRTEGNAVQRRLEAEAASGRGVVVASELPVLTSPRRRAGMRLRALWRSSWRHYRWIVQIQDAQLEMAMLRWHAAHGRIDLERAQLRDRALQDRILALKQRAPRRLSLARRPRKKAASANAAR